MSVESSSGLVDLKGEFCFSPQMSERLVSPVYVCGAMASGKAALGVSLAKELGGEIVNGDVAQAFEGLSRLSGVAHEERRGDVEHHLYGVLGPKVDCDPLAFRELVVPVIEAIQSRGKVPIVVGGSGVYLKTLTHGPSSIPGRDDALRAKFEDRSTEDLVEELKVLDPEGAAGTDLKNRRYVTRGLEICLLSGQKMSALKAEQAAKFDEISQSLRGFYLLWDNEEAKQRISSRSMQTLEKGGIEEVTELREVASETCRRTIGFSEIEAHLDGKLTLKECHKELHTSTRRSAKRQRSWIRKEAWVKDVICPVAFDQKFARILGGE